MAYLPFYGHLLRFSLQTRAVQKQKELLERVKERPVGQQTEALVGVIFHRGWPRGSLIRRGGLTLNSQLVALLGGYLGGRVGFVECNCGAVHLENYICVILLFKKLVRLGLI